VRYRRHKKTQSLFQKSLTYAIGFNAVWIVHLGKKNGLFSSIASSGAISPAVLAKKTHLFAPAVEGWCSAAVCLGYLSEKNGKVDLPASVKELVLDEQSLYYIAGQFAYSALRSLEYSSFDDLFLTGVAKSPSSSNTIKAFEEVTSWDHYAFLNAIKTRHKRLHRLLLKGCSVLDVGCGAGRFMQRMNTNYPRSKFTGIDPYADKIERVKQKTEDGKSKDITILSGSGETMNFQDLFDLVYLGESLYLMDNKQQAIRNCYNALSYGGTIAILEGLLQDERGCKTSDENKMIATMQLDFVLQGHEFMSKKQVVALLRQAGFKNIKLDNLGVSFYLVTANKQSN
jgi:SAM-dependent methyltransferase